MKKLIIILFYILNFTFLSVFADDIKIISRSEWWADETWRYADSEVWKNYFDKLYKDSSLPETETQKKQRIKNQEINNYLSKNYKEDNTLVEFIKEEKWHQLFWPIWKTNYVKSIVIHHTDTSTWWTSIDAIKSIYKYHTLTRWWGDIGYNYLIWFDWEIYEWRAWWDYVVWAHALRNNRSSIWISIIWKYNHEKISEKQYESLKKLVQFLTKKYGIDVNNSYDYHRDCIWNKCDFHIETYKDNVIVWHRDVWHTNCPWDEFYKQIQILKNDLKSETFWFKLVKNNFKPKELVKSELDKKLDKLSEYELLKLLAQIDYSLDKKNDLNLKNLRSKIYSRLYKEKLKNTDNVKLDYDKNDKIKVKLSYPYKDYITVKNWTNIYDIKLFSWKLLVNDKVEYNKINIKSLKWWFLEVLSWERIPSWDKEKKYNDNKFKWNLFLYVKNNEIVVVNEVNFSDYLKWLWEVSDSDNPEKIKTIIIAARTYAKWYTTKARKFPWEIYDASDNPDVFQKYLWYSLELRSPNINKLVDQTSGQVITYNWDIIKAWYFSQSNWKTLSFKDYCTKNWASCKNIDYPYLTWVFDPWSVWKSSLWHWVGISWAWATYLAKKWWTNDMIIKYFLKWVKINSI